MSSNLEWRPTDPVGDGLCDDLKFIIRRAFGEPVCVTMTNDHAAFLTGVIAATENKNVKKDCEKLLKAIGTHGAIDVEEVHR